MSVPTGQTSERTDMSIEQIRSVEDMSDQQLDALPIGAIRLDRDGTILSYNAREAAITGRDPHKVIGRNFFREVAPCTNVQAFAGRFRDGVSRGDLHVVFPYRFDFQMAPRDVTVTLFYSQATESGWVFVRESAS